MKRLLIGLAATGVLLGYTRWVWMSGFDQGVAVSLCVMAAIVENDGKLADENVACIDAKKGESNPLWLLRRRGDA